MAERDNEKHNVLSVTRMTTHNGPGFRTLILFKGCPLRCIWCSTPESQKPEPEIAVYPDKCIQCEQCIHLCPRNAITTSSDLVKIDRSRCDACGICAQECYAGAIKVLGRPMSVGELLEEVRKDSVVHKHSHGGVTVSGGEPLLNPSFASHLLKTFKENSMNIGVDTCGHVPWANIEPLLPYIDFFLWDIKHMNPEKHKELTGVSNELILKNARAVSEKNVPIYIRVPVIPGLNDSQENFRALCEFSQGLRSLVEVDLLPLHHLGKARYISLDRVYPIENLPLIDNSEMQKIKGTVESFGLKCDIVG